MRKFSIFLLIVILFQLVITATYMYSATNPFANRGRAVENNNTQQNNNQVAPAKPGFFKKIWYWFTGLQKKLNSYLSTKIRKIKENFTILTFFLIVLISIVYGSLHGLGPGHGKLVVSSYLIKEDSSVKEAMWLSIIIAFTHVFTAIVLALIFGSISKLNTLGGPDKARRVAMLISGILIMGLGVYFFISRLLNKSEKGSEKIAEEVEKETKLNKWRLLFFGISAGIVPCPVSMTVVLFGIYLGALSLSLISVIGISLGIAVTIFFIGYLTIKLRGGIIKVSKRKEKLTERIQKILGVASALFIIILGFFVLTAYFA